MAPRAGSITNPRACVAPPLTNCPHSNGPTTAWQSSFLLNTQIWPEKRLQAPVEPDISEGYPLSPSTRVLAQLPQFQSLSALSANCSLEKINIQPGPRRRRTLWPRPADGGQTLAFTGRLEGLTVFDILQYLGLLKKSGKLTLTRMGSSGVFVFRNGEVVSAACDSVQNALGNILIKHEYLTEDALRIALELQHLSPKWKRLGTILVEQGFVAPSVLYQAIRNQIEQVLIELMTWDAGFFRFENMETTGEDSIVAGIDPEHLVHGELFQNVHKEDAWKEPLKQKEIEAELDRVFQWMNHANQRSHPRVPVRFTVEVEQAEMVHHGTCLNLSQGGMFIATECPPATGTEILLDFAPPILVRPVSTPARVAWVRGGGRKTDTVTGMGVQFLNPEPYMAGVIGSVVDRLHQQASADSSRLLLPSR